MDHFVSNLGYSLLTNSLSWLFGDQRIVKEIVGKEAPRSNPKKQGRFIREQKSLSKGKCFSGLVWDIPTPREALQTLDSPLGRGISGITLEKSPIRSLWSLSKMLSISAVEGWVLTSFRLCRTQIHPWGSHSQFPRADSSECTPRLWTAPSEQKSGSGVWNPPGKAPTTQIPTLH